MSPTARILFVTSHPEKAREAERLGFPIERISLDLPEPQALAPGDVVEAKARAGWALVARPIIVEDTGLHVEAWGGFPGALVKWLERSGGIEALPRMLEPFSNRRATAVCAIAYFDGASVVRASGDVRGSIAPAPRGTAGFGWDSIFLPEGSFRTFAEMAPEEKDAISHRRRAWDALSAKLAMK